jgi:DNA-binding NarL/FixJ family response regulator
MDTHTPVRIAITNDFELVVAGLARMLSRFPDRVRVLDTAVESVEIDHTVDVALFDTFGHPADATDDIVRLKSQSNVHRVAVFTWKFDSSFIDRALAAGCTGYLSKALDAEQLVTALEQVARGHQVVSDDPMLDRHTSPERGWPGRSDGLSERESEVLVLIAEGLSNLEIARDLSISPNSVKAHIRSGYRKLGVATRAQAVRAVLERDMVRRG